MTRDYQKMRQFSCRRPRSRRWRPAQWVDPSSEPPQESIGEASLTGKPKERRWLWGCCAWSALWLRFRSWWRPRKLAISPSLASTYRFTLSGLSLSLSSKLLESVIIVYRRRWNFRLLIFWFDSLFFLSLFTLLKKGLATEIVILNKLKLLRKANENLIWEQMKVLSTG